MSITKEICYLVTSSYLTEAICQFMYFSGIEKFERSHLQVESIHSDRKQIFCDFSKFVGSKAWENPY